MGTIMIQCPRTGCEISTGMKADREKYNRLPVFFALTFCPFCQIDHEWFAPHAWVRDTERPQELANWPSRMAAKS